MSAIAGAAIGLAGDIALGQINKHNAQQATQEDFQRQVQFWEMQNQYNSPAMQVQRLRQAGINPNQFFSSGNMNNTADSAPNTAKNEYAQSGAYKMQMMQHMLQMGNLQADIKLKEAQANAQNAQTGVFGAQQAMSEFTLNFEKSVADLRRSGIVSENQLRYTNSLLNLVSAGDTLATQPYRINALGAQIRMYNAQADEAIASGKLKGEQANKVKQEIANLKQIFRSLKMSADYEDVFGAPLSTINAPGLWGTGVRLNSTPSLISGLGKRLYIGASKANDWYRKNISPIDRKMEEGVSKLGKSFSQRWKNRKRYVQDIDFDRHLL